MATIARTLSTGDHLVFDDESRELYLIPEGKSEQPPKSVDEARRFVEAGVGQRFDRETLQRVHHALEAIVLLGP